MQRQQLLQVFPKSFSKVEIRLKFDDIGNFFSSTTYAISSTASWTEHKGLRYKGWDVISEVHQLVVFPPTYFRRETGLVAYPRLKYLTPPLSVKIHLIFIIF